MATFPPELDPTLLESVSEEISLPIEEETFDPHIINSEEEDVSAEPIPTAFRTIFDLIEQQERPVREVQLRQWKLQELFWQGIQRLFWDDELKDLRSIDGIANQLPEDFPYDISDFGKIVNVYRAYGEVITGALTAALPVNRYFPKDADKISDILKAKGYSKLAEFIAMYNEMQLKLIRAYVIAYNQGMIAAYNYNHTSEKYGTVQTPKQVPFTQEYKVTSCPSCGEVREEKYDSAAGIEITTDEVLNCPNHSDEQIPLQTSIDPREEMRTEYEQTPKSRQIIEFWGPLNVKIPASAQTIEQVGWLVFQRERHIAEVKAKYPKIRDLITGGESNDNTYERYARANFELNGEYLTNYVTESLVWLRPWAYELITNDEVRELLIENYPDGAYVVFENDIFAEACPSILDDHWTLSENPLSNRLLCESQGRGMVDIQEMTNDLILLELETIKYGISATFADPEYFDFNAWRNSKATPGGVYPAKAPQGGNLSSAFHETKAATLSQNVPELEQKLRSFSEFISHTPPSIFGGPAQGSKTFAEYEQSKNQGLQVLSILFKVITTLYKKSMAKAVKAYHKSMLEDEKYAVAKGDNFVNIVIKKAELDGGDLGEVFGEINDQFPVSWLQKRGMLLELINSGNEYVMQMLTHPENARLIKELLGRDDIFIPGDVQRNKALYTIALLLHQVPQMPDPTQMDPMNPQMAQPKSSVPVEQFVDDPAIQAEVFRAYMASEHGQYQKENNPEGYMNVTLFLTELETMLAMQAQAQAESEKEDKPKKEKDESFPVTES